MAPSQNRPNRTIAVPKDRIFENIELEEKKFKRNKKKKVTYDSMKRANTWIIRIQEDSRGIWECLKGEESRFQEVMTENFPKRKIQPHQVQRSPVGFNPTKPTQKRYNPALQEDSYSYKTKEITPISISHMGRKKPKSFLAGSNDIGQFNNFVGKAHYEKTKQEFQNCFVLEQTYF